MDGDAPREVTCVIDETPGIEVDQHSITVCRYDRGLSKMETRWGTFTDPWTIQPQPVCGFVLVGTDGTIATPDYATYVTVQTRARPEPTKIPVDPLGEGQRNPVEHLIHCLDHDLPLIGPLDPDVSLTGQRIVDTAARSARNRRSLALLP